MFPELEISLSANENPTKDDPRYKALVQRIAEMLATQPESLFSMLYRLDINEEKLKKALSPENPVPPNESIALLVIQRQIARQQTKEKYKADKTTTNRD